MATAEVDVYNLALQSIGTRATVATTTESSREAQVCNRWYADVRDMVFRAAYWPSAKSYARLALLVERDPDADWVITDPEPGYTFAYGYPDNMLAPRFLSGFAPFTLGLHNNTTPAIMTDVEDALMVYTRRQTNVQLWDQGLLMAIAHTLGAYIALSLTGKPSRVKFCFERAQFLVSEARAVSANLNAEQYEAIPEWLSARGYGSTASTKYIYPFGKLIEPASGLGVN